MRCNSDQHCCIDDNSIYDDDDNDNDDDERDEPRRGDAAGHGVDLPEASGFQRAARTARSPMKAANLPADLHAARVRRILASQRDGEDGSDSDDDDTEKKSPRGSRPSPAPAPRNKIIPFGGPSLRSASLRKS